MELLATIHWLAKQENVTELHDIYQKLENWEGKKERFKEPKHVESAWKHLKALHWL